MKFFKTFFLLSFIAQSAISQINIRFDYSNAEQTIAFFNKASITDADINALVKTDGLKSIIRKIHSTDSIAKIALRKAHEGIKATGSETGFQYTTINKNLNQLKRFLDTIKLNEQVIVDSVQSFNKYVPNEKQMTVKVVFLLGSYSGGFTFGEDSLFYIGVQHYKYDVASIINTAQHELFHVVQSRNFNSFVVQQKLEKTNNDSSLYFYYLARNIFIEGSAEFVADFTKLKQNTPNIKEMTEHFEVNNNRMEENFYLTERILIDAYKNNKAIDIDKYYAILFYWNWNNPGYAVGKLMTKELVKEYGIDVLKKYLQADPMLFIKDYATTARTKKLDYQFSKEFEDILNVVIAKVDEVKLTN